MGWISSYSAATGLSRSRGGHECDSKDSWCPRYILAHNGLLLPWEILTVVATNEADRTNPGVPLRDQAVFTQRWDLKVTAVTQIMPQVKQWESQLSQTAQGQQQPPSVWWGSAICQMSSVTSRPPAPVAGLLFLSRWTFLMFILPFLLIYNYGKAHSSIKASSENLEPKRATKLHLKY